MDQAGNPALPGDTSQVYAVVVNWNRPADTITCLESLASQQNVHLHVLVVDNGSTDGSAAQIQAAFPEVEMVRSPENLGYGPGANLGIRRALQAGAEYILLLNNDATIAQDALSQLLKYDQDGVGILAPLIYYAAPPDRIWSAGGDTHPLTLEKSSPYRNKTDPGGWPETIARDFIPGTAILVPGRVFEEIGIFDEQFRMYYDDADFCERIRRAGLSILVIPQAKAWHQVSASSGGSDSPNERYWMARSSVSFFRKFAAPWQWIAIIPYRLGSAFRTSFRLLRRGAYPAIAAYWRGCTTACAGGQPDPMNAPLNLHCPSCSQPLEEHEAAPLECRECGQTYSQTLGIPDLRGPGFEDTASDQTIVKLLRDAYKTASYEELLTIRIKNAPTYGDLIGHEVDYLRGEAARSELMIEMFRRQLRSNFGAGNTGTALDLGSGTGTSLPLLAEIFEQVVGLEPSLPECILAKKYLETNGVENVRLVQAYGQHIPFKTGVFDFVSALNVLEHVFELRQVLDEVHRTLGDGGQFAGDSRNRFDLFTPEPHVKIRWVGLLPRKWAPAYVRLRRGVGYESTYLLSYRELKRGLQSAFGHHHRVTFPQVTAYGLSPTLDQWVQRISRIPALNSLTLWVFPSHLALAHKPAEGRSGP